MPDTTKNSPTQSTRVVVLGSGYAGIHAVRQLLKQSKPVENLEITLVSNTDYLLYVTMIYEVAAGNLAPSSVRQSVRTLLANDDVQFLQGDVKRVDFDNQTVSYDAMDAHAKDSSQLREGSLSYDYLISAIGSETEFYGTPGAAEHAYTLKTLPDSKAIKNTLINHFEEASLATSEAKKRELLSVVVVGGGPTGVTLSAKIADLLNNELAQVFPELYQLAEITIIESKEKLLSQLDPWFSTRSAKALEEKKCVKVLTNSVATAVRPDGVVCGDSFISSQCVIWTAGVRAREFTLEAKKEIEMDTHCRRLHVKETLQLPTYRNVFVAGDQAWVNRPDEGPYPMRAQFAVRQGCQAADNILHLMRDQSPNDFHWADKGVVVSLGHGRTYAKIVGFHFSGPLATIAYKSIYLMSTIGARAKLQAILEWGMNMFLPRDVSEL